MTGKAEAVKDKNGKTFAFCAETSGSLKGTGVNGERTAFFIITAFWRLPRKEPAMRPLRSENRIWTADERTRDRG